jgi:hypothetical protein
MEQHRDHRDLVNISLRFDKALYQRLVEAAKREVRSLNGEVNYRLRQSIERETERAAS